jgi:UDP-N-acetylmuramyl pentapeptide phosphotransferase/UDP-N-acetylglucosamine-1-phosphate transferase
MLGPLILWLALAALNFTGKIFVGNIGSFAIGMTIASFAVITDLKLSLMVSIIPYILNSVLILFTAFFYKKRARVSLDGNKLVSNQRQSLVTLITYRRPMTERKIVALISLLMVIFVSIAVLIEPPWPLLT